MASLPHNQSGGVRFSEPYEKVDVVGERDAGCTTKFAPVKSLRFSELFFGILLSEFRFTAFFFLGSGFMNPPPSVFSNHERKSPQRSLGRSLERMSQCNFFAPP